MVYYETHKWTVDIWPQVLGKRHTLIQDSLETHCKASAVRLYKLEKQASIHKLGDQGTLTVDRKYSFHGK